MFQIVRLTLDDRGEIAVRRPLQPLFELREDAMAMAEFDASRLWGDYGCDDERDCWWATDPRGHKYRFIVESVGGSEAAAWIRSHCCAARRWWRPSAGGLLLVRNSSRHDLISRDDNLEQDQ